MKAEKSVNYKMIILAREARGKSQVELAEELNISQGNLSKIEQDIYPISDEILEKLIKSLDFPKNFFYQKIEKIPVNQQFHRRRKIIQKKYLDEIDANLTIQRHHIKTLLQSVEIEDNLPRLSIKKYGSPEQIASKVRYYWKIPNGPISNISTLLENNGVIIIYTSYYERLDGMSLPDENNIPIIYLNKNKTVDRQRFTLAHELGHLVMHTDYIPKEKDDVEDEADRFASEFLMPEEEFKSSILGKRMSLEELMDLKRYWKVSMAAIIYKANKLNLITPQRYRSLNVELSRAGYKSQEPALNIELDEPSILKDLINAHLNQLDYSRKQLAEILSLNELELVALYLSGKLRVL